MKVNFCILVTMSKWRKTKHLNKESLYLILFSEGFLKLSSNCTRLGVYSENVIDLRSEKNLGILNNFYNSRYISNSLQKITLLREL